MTEKEFIAKIIKVANKGIKHDAYSDRFYKLIGVIIANANDLEDKEDMLEKFKAMTNSIINSDDKEDAKQFQDILIFSILGYSLGDILEMKGVTK